MRLRKNVRVKNIFYKSLLVFLCYSCSPGSSTDPNPREYIFECSVDNKNIKLKFRHPTTNQIGVGSISIASEIQSLVTTFHCNDPGSYCFLHTLKILGQSTGTYTPQNFVVETTEGPDKYTYFAHDISGLVKGNVSVTISTIQRGSSSTDFGVCKATFSGTVIRIINGGGTEVPMTITGKFELPINP